MLALSTAYFTLRSPEPSGEAIAQGVLDLGFSRVELDYRVSESQLKGLGRFLASGRIEAVSIHHPFPRPAGADPETAHTGGPLLTSVDRDERRAALRVAGESLARAQDLGVEVVVVHLGRVDLGGEVDSRALERRVREGQGESAECAELRRRLLRVRAARAAPHREAALSSLDALANEALRRGVQLGLENRYHAEEIPDGEELALLFRTLEGAPLGYWHDTGHAASLTAQGVLGSPTQVLEAFAERTLGFHLHDARGLDDHRAPGQGELDFAPLAPLAGPQARLVLEVHPKAAPEALQAAWGVLAQAGLAVHGAAEPEASGAG
ncbi:MAG: hypothetical protein Kow0092_08590 [Deferrisomatales bacterium]